MKLVQVFFFMFSSCILAQFPFPRCNRNDPNLNQCLSQAIFQAIRQMGQPFPHVGTPGLNSYQLGRLAFEASTADYYTAARCTKYKIHGLTRLSVPPFVNFDLVTNTLTVEFPFPELIYDWNFNYKGHLFGVSINSTGYGGKTHKKNYRFIFNLVQNRQHLRLLNTTLLHPHETVGIVTYFHENTPDSSITGQGLSDLYNQNRKLVTRAVSHELELTFATRAHQIFDNILASTPIDEFLLP